MRTLRRLALALALAASFGAQPAQAETTGYVFTYGSTFVPGDTRGIVNVPLVHMAGNEMVLTNVDALESHTVTSEGFKPNSYERLFGSDATNFREQRVVVGVADLTPGTYGFFCEIHTNMRGAIDVVG